MELIEIRARNFRTIENEQHLPVHGSMTLVGPNNSGKTNLLRALQTLFTGYHNIYNYSRKVDLTFGVSGARTSIIATFDGDDNDDDEDEDVYQAIDELHDLLGTKRSGTQFSLTLYFTATNTPVYQIFPNIKRPGGTPAARYSLVHKTLITDLLDRFRVHYVPSAKSVEQIYDELLTPFLRKKVSKVIEPHLTDIKASLADASKALNEELESAGLGSIKAGFSLPQHSLEDLVSGFDFMLSDPEETSIGQKGMGVQTTALLAAFRWITKQEKYEGKSVIWLLEEPESYLHPSLSSNCSSIIENLEKDSTVIKTTHSMSFVPQNPNRVCGTTLNKKNRTEITQFKTFSEAVSNIREALGVKFSDFYNLDEYNIMVEGPSDREIYTSVLNTIPETSHGWTTLRASQMEDFGGVHHLSGFLRATYQFISKERACIAVFDGDDAGQRERRSLQQFFGNKQIPFQPNEHFVSIRSGFAIEGLFPDSWIIQMHEDHPGWFETYSVDAQGSVEPFKIRDGRKSNAQNWFLRKAAAEEDLVWANRFISVFEIINNALALLEVRLNNVKKIAQRDSA